MNDNEPKDQDETPTQTTFDESDLPPVEIPRRPDRWTE
jgi:hypothetical protein